jgi:hypothetical protein
MASNAGGFTPNHKILKAISISTNIPLDIQAMPRIGQEFQDMLCPDPLEGVSFTNQPPYLATISIPLSSFQQSFVPQDLW